MYMKKQGAYATFDPETGIKTYKSKQACDFAYTTQQKAYELGAAPKVIKRVDNLSYQTDIADTSFFLQNFKVGAYYNRVFPELHEILKPLFANSPNRVEKAPDNVDLKFNNLGLYNGKVVMIDFY